MLSIDVKRYGGKYVALDLRKPNNITIIDSASDLEELLKRLEEKVDLRYVDVEYVPPEDVIVLQ